MKKQQLAFFLSIGLAGLIIGGVSATYAEYSTSKRLTDLSVGVKRIIYVDIDQCDNWQLNSPKFACYVWDSTGANVACFVSNAMMDTVTAATTYRIAIPSGYDRCIFVRMNPSESVPSFDYDDYSGYVKCWGQTADLWIGKDTEGGTDSNNCFYVKNNDNNKSATGNWGTIPTSYTYTYTPS